MKVASEKYGLSIMKDDEALLFAEACLEGGNDVKTALQDMRMIDDLLFMKRLHLSIHGHIKKTQAGYYRKGSSLYDSYNSIIEGRAKLKNDET